MCALGAPKDFLPDQFRAHPPCVSALRWQAFISTCRARRAPFSDAGLDVHCAAGAVRGRQGTLVLPGRRVSNVVCGRRGLGRAMAEVAAPRMGNGSASLVWIALVFDVVLIVVFMLPISPVKSPCGSAQSKFSGDLREEAGLAGTHRNGGADSRLSSRRGATGPTWAFLPGIMGRRERSACMAQTMDCRGRSAESIRSGSERLWRIRRPKP